MSNNPQTLASLSPAFADALQNSRHALLTEDPAESLARVLTQFHDEHRAEVLRDAEEICDEAGASYTANALNEHADAAYTLMERFRRKAEEAEQTAAVVPAVPVPPVPDPDLRALVDAYLTATHKARHDVLGVGGACYGCALRDWMRRMADAPAVLPPTAHAADLRDRMAAAMYEAEYPDFGWAQAHDEDREQALQRADAVLAVLPPPADRAAVLLEVADWLKAWRPEFFERWAVVEQDRYEGGVDAAAAELRRMADEAQQPAECSPACSEQHTYCPGCALAADEARQQPGTETRKWCKCPSCWGWFVEDHPGEDLDELGRDLAWWSGLPEHRDAPAGVSGPGRVADEEPAETRRCDGFPATCPNLRVALPTPGGYAVAVRCGCADEPAAVSQPDTETPCTCGGKFPLGHLHADSHAPTAPGPGRVADEEAAS